MFAAVLLSISYEALSYDFKLQIITEDLPRWNYLENGELKGFVVDIVKDIKKRVEDNADIKVMPWAKGYNLLQNEHNVALFTTARSPWRENLFQWVGPVGSDEWVFVARADNQIKITSLEDAKNVHAIAAYKDDVREQFLREKGFTNIDVSLTDQACLNKLLTGRVDLWIQDELDLKAKIAGQNANVRVVYSIQTIDFYIAFSKGVPAAVVKEWQDALDAMKKDGVYREIYKKWYGGAG